MHGKRKLTTVIAVAAFSLSLGLAACGSKNATTPAAQPTGMMTSAPTAMPTEMTSPGTGGEFGTACASIPSAAKQMMAKEPVATAAASNPQLATLVAAVKKAGLAETLNSAQGITVFAPVNDAFTKIPKDQLNAVLNNPEQLKKLLSYHVVSQKIAPDQLAGTHKTLEGQDITVTGSGTNFKVNDTATIVCGNIPTRNGTLYLVDGVLMPPS